MSTKTAVNALQEYVSVPLGELVESSTNPRKSFDEPQLQELAESIRSKGILSPLLVRRENSHFEIISGARRYRAAQLDSAAWAVRRRRRTIDRAGFRELAPIFQASQSPAPLPYDSAATSRIVTPMTRPTMSASRG